MALWIKTRPDEQADLAELAVADRLVDLPDTWLVIWGYYFSAHRGGALDREGDFIVQAPNGQVLVIEVKGSTSFRRFIETGEWETEDRKDPREQLNAECQSVIAALRAVAEDGSTPAVSKALALPMMSRHDYDAPGIGWENTAILDRETLDHFRDWWTTHFADAEEYCGKRRARELLVRAFGGEAEPKALRHFATMTDRMLVRHAHAEFRLLDHLAENQKFSFTGGPGTGKTFFALECARRFAEQGEGRRVLMPVFNLPLCHQLRRLFAQKPPKRGTITVLSQGEIARLLFAQVGLTLDFPPQSAPQSERGPFFAQTLPAALTRALASPGVTPVFDALVVDEAQDHDTALPGVPDGWWAVYHRLLVEPDTAPVALCHDGIQRALFRADGEFRVEKIHRLFPSPVRVRLDRCVRYTAPIWRYLQKIGDPAAEAAPNDLLPSGAPVTIKTVESSGMAAAIEATLAHWASLGIITRPEHVLLLSPRRTLANTSLAGVTAITGAPLVEFDETTDGQPGRLRHLNIHRAKGLDERAVIVFDLLPPEASQDAALTRQNHLLGASRARQALAVLWLKPEPAPAA